MASGTQDPGADPDDSEASGPGEQVPGAGPDPDAAWHAIVAHYGDRAVLDDPDHGAGPTPDPPAAADPARLRRLFEPLDRPQAAPPGRSEQDTGGPSGPDADLGRAPDAPFVPPPPPPVPGTTPDRRAAWIGALGAPVALLLSLVLGIDLPQVVALGLVAWFVGGFCYLVLTMSREPRDPGDDGARV